MKMNSDDITKKALLEKSALEFAKKDAIIRDLENQLAVANKQIREMKKHISISNTSEDVTRKILSLKARMLSPTTIKDRLEYTGVEIELEEIKDIVYNIDELDGVLINYYNECVEAYNNQLKTNNNILKEKAISENQFMIDQIKEIIQESSDNFEKAKNMDKLDKYLNTMNSLLKDVVLESEDKDKSFEIINIMSDDYEKQKSNVFKLQIDENVKVIN